jgi:hypothetical protein
MKKMQAEVLDTAALETEQRSRCSSANSVPGNPRGSTATLLPLSAGWPIRRRSRALIVNKLIAIRWLGGILGVPTYRRHPRQRKSEKVPIFLLIVSCLAAMGEVSHARVVASENVTLTTACPTVQSLAIVTGGQLPALLGTQVQQISLLSYADGRLSPISFQIDRKDEQDRYVIEAGLSPDSGRADAVLDDNDELVFRAQDRGDRLPGSSELARSQRLIEIQLSEPESGTAGWVYIRISSGGQPLSADRPVRYLPDTDSVKAQLYHIGFSAELPFLVDTFHWKLPGQHAWSPDISDTMKIRHRGIFMGFVPFQRTHADYSSQLVAVRRGPLRIIRRTSNRIRMLWKLRSPALYVDYIMMPDGFVMDTVIDIPFNIGLFFSDVVTLTTMDWNDDPALPDLTIHSPDGTALPVNGRMSGDKQRFNTVNESAFSISSSLGELFVRLDIPEDFPIQPWLYLKDEVKTADAPEHHRGQFGNVGFRTTEWERIDSDVHHLKFTICMSSGN